MIALPNLLKVADIANAIGWSVDRTRYALKKLGIIHKRGRHYVTTKSELAHSYPEMLDAMEADRQSTDTDRD